MTKRVETSIDSTKPEVHVSSTGGVSVRASDILGNEKAMRLIRAAKRAYPKPSNTAGPVTARVEVSRQG